MTQDRKPPERTEIKGWSPDAARRNRRFLQSVDPDALTGEPFALTLTTREMPPDAKTWAAMVRALFQWLRRRGMIRYHWVTEWQERGAPHLHAMVFMDALPMVRALEDATVAEDDDPDSFAALWGRGRPGLRKNLRDLFGHAIGEHWCHQIAAPYGAGERGQHIVSVSNLSGWVAYLSKHAIRGADHYQRAGGSLPKGWQKSGRLWSKGGDWPTSDEALEVDPMTAHRLHRLIRRWQRARALDRLRAGRGYGNKRQIAAGRGELKHLARSGSGKRRPERLRLALQLLLRAERNGSPEDALHRLREQVAQERAEAAEAHRKAAMVRGSSTMAPDAVTRPLLSVAMDHEAGFASAWRTLQERRALARTKSFARPSESAAHTDA